MPRVWDLGFFFSGGKKCMSESFFPQGFWCVTVNFWVPLDTRSTRVFDSAFYVKFPEFLLPSALSLRAWVFSVFFSATKLQHVTFSLEIRDLETKGWAQLRDLQQVLTPCNIHIFGTPQKWITNYLEAIWLQIFFFSIFLYSKTGWIFFRFPGPLWFPPIAIDQEVPPSEAALPAPQPADTAAAATSSSDNLEWLGFFFFWGGIRIRSPEAFFFLGEKKWPKAGR